MPASFHQHLIRRFEPRYGRRYAQTLAFLLLDDLAGLSTDDVIVRQADAALTAAQRDAIEAAAARIEQGVPYQQAVGFAAFCGLRIPVAPGVLIPRPETEELVQWVVADQAEQPAAPSVLDIGTGSGCIALALKQAMPAAQVEAWDVSAEALAQAEANAERLGLDIRFRQADILREVRPDAPFDVVVSNPPYVCESEKSSMDSTVLDHEPALALFVPDDHPLLFYERIVQAEGLLKRGGSVYFEINQRFGPEVLRLLQDHGFSRTELRNDQFGNPRLAKGTKI